MDSLADSAGCAHHLDRGQSVSRPLSAGATACPAAQSTTALPAGGHESSLRRSTADHRSRQVFARSATPQGKPGKEREAATGAATAKNSAHLGAGRYSGCSAGFAGTAKNHTTAIAPDTAAQTEQAGDVETCFVGGCVIATARTRNSGARQHGCKCCSCPTRLIPFDHTHCKDSGPAPGNISPGPGNPGASPQAALGTGCLRPARNSGQARLEKTQTAMVLTWMAHGTLKPEVQAKELLTRPSLALQASIEGYTRTQNG